MDQKLLEVGAGEIVMPESDFILDSRLESDCHILGRLDTTLLLLMDNSLAPWFILVPMVEVIELHQMERDAQLLELEHINLLSAYLKDEFSVDKVNVAAIGNIVRQLHIHVVGRSEQDYCWPSVVWGAEGRKAYSQSEVQAIAASIQERLGGAFVAASVGQ